MSVEDEIAELRALMAEVLERVAQHGGEHDLESADPMIGRYQEAGAAGAPTHEAPSGTRYHESATPADYTNKSGGSEWTLLETGGAGAPMGAHYVVMANDGDLTGDRRLVAGSGLTAVDGGANGAVTLSVDNDHPEAHAPESHTGQGATAAELENLTDASNADSLHKHAHSAVTGSATDDHHDPVTLGTGDAALSLSGQELTLAAVVTPTEHTAIGNASPHHTKYTNSEARTAVPYATEISFGWDPQSPQIFAP